ncbi:NAD(P)H-dependent flavin oxidoreductase [Humibacillus xanthopallidus]|uniref:Propionate 3-nitronate monooxygenase n=1 Tax=Humibacillus xanthopallidus TaxID=412689 RepID=A0A543HUU9_9MICO|nr:nitronate monooxygenase [Humibacillus xanthopallidus]TQM62118.1 nitroalkane oxidase [Humibacillus xanthopallidus]
MTLRSIDAGVVAAPMAGGASTPDLVAAVGEAGGFGFLAGGYLTTEQLAAQVAGVWDLTSRPFGVNLFVPDTANVYAVRPGGLQGADRAAAVAAYQASLAPDAAALGVEPGEPRPGDTDDWERKLDLVVRERVTAVSFTFGLPSAAVLGELARAGIESVVTVTDVDEASAALAAGVDGLCVQGVEAGGHRGTLDPTTVPDDSDLAAVVERVRQTAWDLGRADVVIMAAGGITTRHRADAVRGAGADAVQVGTALLLTPEAGTGLAYRRALADAAHGSTRVTRAFSGRLGRCLETDFVRRHDEEAPAAYPEVHHVTVPLRRASAQADKPDVVALWAGTGWRAARAVPAATVVSGLAR